MSTSPSTKTSAAVWKFEPMHTQSKFLNVVNYGVFDDPMMGHRIGYAAETPINRKDFGMRFDMMLDGKFIVSEEIQVNIEGEIVEAPEN